MVKVSLLGTSQIENITNAGISKSKLNQLLEKTAEVLADEAESVFAVPDDGVYFELALKYREKGGKKFVGVVPSGDEKYGIDHIRHNLDKIDERINVKDWYNLNGEIAAKGDLAIVMGYSAGVFSDLSFLKYHKEYFGDRTKVVIFENTASQKLPKELEEDIGDVEYITSVEELKKIIRKME